MSPSKRVKHRCHTVHLYFKPHAITLGSLKTFESSPHLERHTEGLRSICAQNLRDPMRGGSLFRLTTDPPWLCLAWRCTIPQFSQWHPFSLLVWWLPHERWSSPKRVPFFPRVTELRLVISSSNPRFFARPVGDADLGRSPQICDHGCGISGLGCHSL